MYIILSKSFNVHCQLPAEATKRLYLAADRFGKQHYSKMMMVTEEMRAMSSLWQQPARMEGSLLRNMTSAL